MCEELTKAIRELLGNPARMMSLAEGFFSANTDCGPATLFKKDFVKEILLEYFFNIERVVLPNRLKKY